MPVDHPFPAGLDGMREIRLPEPVRYAPQTVGWWILFAVLLLVLAFVAWRLWKRVQRNAYRRLALGRMDGLAPAELPLLLKRTALDAYPREQVAHLTGRAWLAFLDGAYGGSGFSSGPGRVLPSLAYDDGVALTDAQQDELTALVRTWIRRHRV